MVPDKINRWGCFSSYMLTVVVAVACAGDDSADIAQLFIEETPRTGPLLHHTTPVTTETERAP